MPKDPSREKFVHLKTFPLTHEISTYGTCRKRVRDGFKYFSRIDEPNGAFTFIDVHGKLQKLLTAELVLMSFMGSFMPGYEIGYRDGDPHHVYLDNLSFRKPKHTINDKQELKQAQLRGMWRCDSRSSNANYRYAATGQTITSDEVLRCLIVCQFKCFYCECSLNPHKWQLDHFHPMAKNGRNQFENLRASCRECNSMKSDFEYEQWIRKIHKVINVFVHHEPEYVFGYDDYDIQD